MRILSFSNVPLDSALGSGYVALGFASALAARGHEVRLLGPEQFEPGRRVLPGRAVFHRQSLGLLRALAAELAEGPWDVLELYGASAWLALRCLPLRRRGRPLVVLRSNGLEPHYDEVLQHAEKLGLVPRRPSRLGPTPASVYAGMARRADALVTVSEWDRDWGVARGLARPERIAWIDNPLPSSYLGRPQRRVESHRFGFCGGWGAHKGALLLGEAVPALLRRFPSWSFVLLGTPPGSGVRELFPVDVRERIVEVAPGDREGALVRGYESLSVLVLPSLFESFGLVAAEAMACGCALVSTRVGFPASLRDGQEVELLAEPSAVELESRVSRLIEDYDLRQRMALAGQRRVQSLNWRDAGDRLETLYATWLDELERGSR